MNSPQTDFVGRTPNWTVITASRLELPTDLQLTCNALHERIGRFAGVTTDGRLPSAIQLTARQYEDLQRDADRTGRGHLCPWARCLAKTFDGIPLDIREEED